MTYVLTQIAKIIQTAELDARIAAVERALRSRTTMKTMDRLYERLTPIERFKIAVAAFGRGDLTEVDRLNDSATWRGNQGPGTGLLRATAADYLAGPVFHRPGARSATHGPCGLLRDDHPPASVGRRRDGRSRSKATTKFEELVELMRAGDFTPQGAARSLGGVLLGAGVSASDMDKMIGMPSWAGWGNSKPSKRSSWRFRRTRSTNGNASKTCGGSGRRDSRIATRHWVRRSD